MDPFIPPSVPAAANPPRPPSPAPSSVDPTAQSDGTSKAHMCRDPYWPLYTASDFGAYSSDGSSINTEPSAHSTPDLPRYTRAPSPMSFGPGNPFEGVDRASLDSTDDASNIFQPPPISILCKDLNKEEETRLFAMWAARIPGDNDDNPLPPPFSPFHRVSRKNFAHLSGTQYLLDDIIVAHLSFLFERRCHPCHYHTRRSKQFLLPPLLYDKTLQP